MQLDLPDLLKQAQAIINEFHKDESLFFSKANITVDFIGECNDGYGFVSGSFPDYFIGLHTLLSDQNVDNKKQIIMTILHELLHIIHADWKHKAIFREQFRIANLAGFQDVIQSRQNRWLQRMQSFYHHT